MDDGFATGYAIGQNDGSCNNNDMGGWGGWLIPLLLIGLLFGGFGFGGGGWGGGFGGGYALQGMATRADITAGFQFQDLQNGIRGLTNGLSDSTYAINNAINGVQSTLCQGFNGVNTTVLQGFNGVERGFCELSHQLSDCCCQTQRAIDGVNYNMATQANALQQAMCTNTRDIIDAQTNGTRAVLDFLISEKLSAKDARIAALENQVALGDLYARVDAKIEATGAELLRRTGHDCPSAAYIVQPPTPVSFPTNCCGTVQFGNNGCGYGNGCGC